MEMRTNKEEEKLEVDETGNERQAGHGHKKKENEEHE